jgi:acetate kinase
VRIKGTPRELTFGRTLIRVQPGAFTEMHIDTDEGNAAGIGAGVEGSLVPGAEATVWDVG